MEALCAEAYASFSTNAGCPVSSIEAASYLRWSYTMVPTLTFKDVALQAAAVDGI